MIVDWADAALPLVIQLSFLSGIAIGLIGLIAKRTHYLVWAGILVLPMSFYLTGNPGARWGILIPFVMWTLAYVNDRQGNG